jgi:hypothetical protein
MKSKNSNEIKQNDLVKKRLAKIMALQCFRNTELENLHSGISPFSAAGNYSDVKVVSPKGEISWDKVSRFNDEEMKVLMIDVVNHCYNFLYLLYNSSKGDEIIELLKEKDVMESWEDPTGDIG